MIDLRGLDKADVLRVLYNNAKCQGMGILHFRPEPMTVEEAREALKIQTYFDYHNGRVMKVDLSGILLDTRMYDCDNGPGAAQFAIDMLREEK